MAGKSTVLRTVAAAVLLAQCGLFLPARLARVPWLDGIELRTFMGDAPVEGKSAWDLEMHETSCARHASAFHMMLHYAVMVKSIEQRSQPALQHAE